MSSTPVRRRAAGVLGLTGLLLCTLGTLVVSAALKAYCLTGWEPKHQPKSCYNDIQTLWYQRDMVEHVAPYTGAVEMVHEAGHLVAVRLGAGQIEYPALTGAFAWAVSLPAHDAATYLVLSVLALAPFAFLTAYALGRVAGRRALLFALSPQLVAYAFLNWDLLPVAATAFALWAWYRKRPGTAAVLLSLGACAKIWPGFVLVPMLLALLLDRDVRAAVRAAALFVVTAVTVNLPFLLNDARGWLGPYLAQSVRKNDRTTNSLWFWLFGPREFEPITVWSTLGILAIWALAVGVGLLRWKQDGAFPTVAVACAMVVGYVVAGRVDSPQYALWVLPFLVVLRVPAFWVAVYSVANLWLWLVWSWLWVTPEWFHTSAVAVHGVVLLLLVPVVLRSRDVVTPSRSRKLLSHHPTRSTVAVL